MSKSFKKSLAKLKDAAQDVQDHLIKLVKADWADCRIVSNKEANDWSLSYPHDVTAGKLALVFPLVVFFECGKKSDGTYEYHGARFGPDKTDYFTGFTQVPCDCLN